MLSPGFTVLIAIKLIFAEHCREKRKTVPLQAWSGPGSLGSQIS